MTHISATAVTMIMPGAVARPATPADVAVVMPQHTQASPAPRPALAAIEEPGTGLEVADAGAACPVPGTEPMTFFPVWRMRGLPTLSRELVANGQLPPPGGKAMPPRIPVVPIGSPEIDAIGPRVSGSSAVSVPWASGAGGIDGPATPADPGSLSRSPEAPARLPREFIGTLPGASGSVPRPVPVPVTAPGEAAAAPDAGAVTQLFAPLPKDTSVLPAWQPPIRRHWASSHPPSTTARLDASPVRGGEPPVPGFLLAPFAPAEPVEPAGTGLTTQRLAAVPETAVLPAPTFTQPTQPGSPQAAVAQLHLPELVGSEEWAEAVAHRLSQLAESPHARANIRLNPPQLGPMQIEVHVEGDRAVVQLAVHHDATRDALEQAVPKLRAQLEGSGFASIDVSVSRNPHRDRQGAGEPYAESSLPPGDELSPALVATGRPVVARLLDAYA